MSKYSGHYFGVGALEGLRFEVMSYAPATAQRSARITVLLIKEANSTVRAEKEMITVLRYKGRHVESARRELVLSTLPRTVEYAADWLDKRIDKGLVRRG